MVGRASFEQGAKLRRWEKKIDDPAKALKQIGALMVGESQDAFKRQKFGDAPWKPRAVPNVYGIISDFAGGAKEPKARRFQSQPALRDTGRLAQSISFRVVGRVVEVGSNVEYAATHQHGGATESETITQAMQKAIWKWLKSKGGRWKSDLGWLLNRKFTGQKLKGRVPARPFVGVTKQTIADVKEVVGVEIFEVRNGSR